MSVFSATSAARACLLGVTMYAATMARVPRARTNAGLFCDSPRPASPLLLLTRTPSFSVRALPSSSPRSPIPLIPSYPSSFVPIPFSAPSFPFILFVIANLHFKQTPLYIPPGVRPAAKGGRLVGCRPRLRVGGEGYEPVRSPLRLHLHLHAPTLSPSSAGLTSRRTAVDGIRQGSLDEGASSLHLQPSPYLRALTPPLLCKTSPPMHSGGGGHGRSRGFDARGTKPGARGCVFGGASSPSLHADAS
ncbi:hypothetical protein DFH09DRAFT_1379488 [Mycena vulgaris]|nr:hypothetical protein DFH09DRAFT_1379488 [Mycena vulgaris]